MAGRAWQNEEMFSEKKPEPSWKRLLPAVLLGLLAFWALAVLVYPVLRPEAGGAAAGVGFDVSRSAAEPSRDRTGSGLELVRSHEAMTAPRPAEPETAKPPGPAEAMVRTLTRRGEGRIREMAQRYSKANPIVVEFGRAWMAYPDLKKLNDDYMRDRDPVKFLKGLAGSKNFSDLLVKYSGQAPLIAFLSEAITQSSPEEQSAALAFMSQEASVDAVAQSVLGALRLNLDALGAPANPASPGANPGSPSPPAVR